VKAMSWWDRYWFRPAPYVDLAMVRIAAVGLQLFLLPVSTHMNFSDLNALPDTLYNPLAVLRLLILPFGWDYKPSAELLAGVYYLALLSGGLALIGAATRVSLFVFGISNIFLIAYHYSFGGLHHGEAPLMIALLVLACGPSGHALSIDAVLRRRRGIPSSTEGDLAGWPIRLIQWMFVLIYLSAVLSKLFFVGGLQWLNGFTLQYELIQDALRKGSLLGMWFSQYHTLVMIGQYVVVIFQATFALAVIFPRLRWIYIPLGLGFHVANMFLLNTRFLEWIALYAVFIPWKRLFELLRERPLLWRQSPGTA
jgi:HTTM domain